MSDGILTHDGSWGKIMRGKIGGFIPLLMIRGIIVEGRDYAGQSWVRDHSQRVYYRRSCGEREGQIMRRRDREDITWGMGVRS